MILKYDKIRKKIIYYRYKEVEESIFLFNCYRTKRILTTHFVPTIVISLLEAKHEGGNYAFPNMLIATPLAV